MFLALMQYGVIEKRILINVENITDIQPVRSGEGAVIRLTNGEVVRVEEMYGHVTEKLKNLIRE